MAPLVDISARRFGSLTVVEKRGTDAKRHALWLCRCDCGKDIVARGHSLKHAGKRSCGCKLQRVNIRKSDRVPDVAGARK